MTASSKLDLARANRVWKAAVEAPRLEMRDVLGAMFDVSSVERAEAIDPESMTTSRPPYGVQKLDKKGKPTTLVVVKGWALEIPKHICVECVQIMDLNSGYFGWYVSLAMRTATKKIPSCNEQKVRGRRTSDDVVELEEMPTDADVGKRSENVVLSLCVCLFTAAKGQVLSGRKSMHAKREQETGLEEEKNACVRACVRCALLGRRNHARWWNHARWCACKAVCMQVASLFFLHFDF